MSNETKTAPVDPALLTSPKLEELQAARKVAMKAQAQLVVDDKIDSPEFETAATEVLSINAEITKEKARLVKEKNDQLAAENRSKAKAELDTALAAIAAGNAPKADDDAKTAGTNAYEDLLNHYLGSVPKAKTADGSAPKSGTKSEQIVAMATAGNTYGQMIAAGMGDGTIRTALTKSTGWASTGSGNDKTYHRI